MAERIIPQRETSQRTSTDNSTRRRMEAKGLFPKRFEITKNGATGYLESEIEDWIANRAADRTPTTRTAAATTARRIKRASAEADDHMSRGELIGAFASLGDTDPKARQREARDAAR
jgi:predicted DNA-binding transcriptional regulator AlpA